MLKIKFQVFLLLFGIGFLFHSCGSSEWSGSEKDRLTKRCRDEGGSKSYCKCYLKNAMKAFPNAKDMEDLDFETSVELSINCE